MPLTNKYGLPAPLVSWLANDTYQRRGDISATQLINPPQLVTLEGRYRDKIVEDAADRIWSALGSAVHSILEDTPGFDYLREHHMIVEFDGWKISMTPDLYDMSTNRLWDYKVTSVWAVNRGLKPEWHKQVNIYAYGLAKNGYPVDDAKVLCILRDWSKLEKLRNRDYPDVQAVVLDAPLLSLVDVDAYLCERVALHKLAKGETDRELAIKYPCTKEEMWAKDDSYACLRAGNKRASRVLPTRNDATNWISENGKGKSFDIIYRAGERTRCEHYCNVKDFCAQYKGV